MGITEVHDRPGWFELLVTFISESEYGLQVDFEGSAETFGKDKIEYDDSVEYKIGDELVIIVPFWILQGKDLI